MEEWKQIGDSNYWISSYGNIKSVILGVAIYLIDSISNSVKNGDPLTIVDFLEKNGFPEAAKAARIFVAQNF